MLNKLIISLLQLPPGAQNPDDNTPIDLSNPFDLIVYILLPIAIIILYILWKRMKKRDKDR